MYSMHHQGQETTEVGGDHFRSTSDKLWATVRRRRRRNCPICEYNGSFFAPLLLQCIKFVFFLFDSKILSFFWSFSMQFSTSNDHQCDDQLIEAAMKIADAMEGWLIGWVIGLFSRVNATFHLAPSVGRSVRPSVCVCVNFWLFCVF